MWIITRTRLLSFASKHPDSLEPLDRWYRLAKTSTYSSLADLRKTFPTADPYGRLVIFNIGGNKYRLITSIHFNRDRIFIRHVLTHREYNLDTWKKEA